MSAHNPGASVLGPILAMRITNLSITASAKESIRRALMDFGPNRASALALVYTSSFTEPDGRTVRGFRPGYLVTPWPTDYLGTAWIRAKLDGAEFYLMPRFKWKVEETYVLDAAWPVFSIEQMPPGDAVSLDATLL